MLMVWPRAVVGPVDQAAGGVGIGVGHAIAAGRDVAVGVYRQPARRRDLDLGVAADRHRVGRGVALQVEHHVVGDGQRVVARDGNGGSGREAVVVFAVGRHRVAGPGPATRRS